jgi:hypothetical protein
MTEENKEYQTDENGFYTEGPSEGMHSGTGTRYAEDGHDIEGYDARGFDFDGIHRETGTEFDSEGRAQNGTAYNHDGYDVDGYNRSGYNEDGYDSEGYDDRGFDCDGTHRDTGTDYDEDGYDIHGEPREDDFDSYLDSYGTNVVTRCGWRHPGRTDDKRWKDMFAGHEIEMYSKGEDTSDVDFVLDQLASAYRVACKGKPLTPSGRCAIAKHDGSLSEGGFETVTVPMDRDQTYGVFQQFEVLGDGRCGAWSYGECVGHHIHVSRTAVSRYTEGKLGVFMNMPDNREFIQFIAQRDADYNAFEEQKRLTRPDNHFRHAVLNMTASTLEFRIFKSNLRTTGILKNYEFCIAAIDFSRESSHAKLQYDQFMRFVASHRSMYRYLHQFMLGSKSRYYSGMYAAMCPSSIATKPRKTFGVA